MDSPIKSTLAGSTAVDNLSHKVSTLQRTSLRGRAQPLADHVDHLCNSRENTQPMMNCGDQWYCGYDRQEEDHIEHVFMIEVEDDIQHYGNEDSATANQRTSLSSPSQRQATSRPRVSAPVWPHEAIAVLTNNGHSENANMPNSEDEQRRSDDSNDVTKDPLSDHGMPLPEEARNNEDF